MGFKDQIYRAGSLGLIQFASLVLLGTSTALAQEASEVQYVRVTEGATVRNFQDQQGKPVGSLKAGDLLRVHSSSVGFYEVSSPSGFPVWVYGEFLARTGIENVLQVTGSGVRMRPLPNSSIESYPLATKLSRGDLVELIKRSNPEADLAGDWVQVWSTPSARGWVAEGEVHVESDLTAAQAGWGKGLRNLTYKAYAPQDKKANTEAAPPENNQADNADSGAGKDIPQEAFRSLAYGNTLLGNALKKGRDAEQGDFDRAIAAYEVVLGMAPEDSMVSRTAEEKLKEAKTHQTLAAVREELRTAELRQAEMLRIWRDEQKKKELERTSHWGRFSGRGWVERQTEGPEVHYYLRWGGEVVFEIACTSGRYDLGVFEGYEVGVRATTLRERTMGLDGADDAPALLDISRLEVISGSSSR